VTMSSVSMARDRQLPRLSVGTIKTMPGAMSFIT